MLPCDDLLPASVSGSRRRRLIFPASSTTSCPRWTAEVGHPQTLGQGESGSCNGGQGPPATRCQESFQETRYEESAGEGLTEGRKEGCRQATAESRHDSSCCSSSDRLALAKLGTLFGSAIRL